MMTGTMVYRKGESGIDTYRIPAIVETSRGTILAFAEARRNSGSDTGDIDLVVKRSTDGGKTWGEMITIWDDADNCCGNPAPVIDRTTGRILLLSTWNNGHDHEKKIHARTSIDTRRVYSMYSDDDGLSWSTPTEITSQAKLPEWTWYATGPCHAIQLQSGRIVIPCNHGNFGTETTSHVIYSDDHGETWQRSEDVKVGNESTVTELPDGSVMLNMRTSGKNRDKTGYGRLVAISKDGGETFGEPYYDEALIEPVCNGSILNYTLDGVPTETLLFSNPETQKSRSNMTVKVSYDSGRTWERACSLTTGPTAYSDLTMLDGGDVACFYEAGLRRPYETIMFARIPASTFVRKPDAVVDLYPEGQDVDLGIVEDGKTLSLGPGESTGDRAETVAPSGNISNVTSPRMEFFVPDKPNGQMVIVCPGGGYGTVCERKEGYDVAKWMNRQGITVCVLVYRLPYGHTTVPLTDVQNAFRYCRAKSESWGIDQIGVMGFSAGGHLAATASVMYTDEVTRPDFSVLIYPVIDLNHHQGTRKNLVGNSKKLQKKYSLQYSVDDNTPRTYLALCQDDKVVDSRSSLLYYNALLDHGVKAEMYIFPNGGHGWGFYSEEPGKRDALGQHNREVFSATLANFLQAVHK